MKSLRPAFRPTSVPTPLPHPGSGITLIEKSDPDNLSPFDPSAVTRASSIAIAGGIASQGLKFLVVIYVARQFSTIEFGWFSFAVAVNAYITIISNFGLPIFGSRVISRSGCVPGELLQEIVCARLFLAAAAVLTCVGVLSLVPQVGHEEFLLVVLFGASNLPLAGLCDWVFQGLHRQDLSAFLNIIWQASWLVFTATCVALGTGILAVAVALIASAALVTIIGYGWLQRSRATFQRTGSKTRLSHRARQVLHAAAPLGWGTLLISVAVWTDAICVRLLRGEFAVAVYAAGNRAALALSMLGTFFVQGAFPLLSRASSLSVSLFESCFAQTLSDLAILFVPGSLWAIWYANEIIALIFRRSDFAAAVPVFRLFQVTLLFFVVNTLLGTGVLVAFHRDHSFRAVLVSSTVLFLGLCPLLTWKWGNKGAALAVLISQMFACARFIVKVRSLVRMRVGSLLRWPVIVGTISLTSCVVLKLSLAASLIPLGLAYVVLFAARERQPGHSLA
jgi:O-antigen/teichoic acid export membrane protein